MTHNKCNSALISQFVVTVTQSLQLSKAFLVLTVLYPGTKALSSFKAGACLCAGNEERASGGERIQ